MKIVCQENITIKKNYSGNKRNSKAMPRRTGIRSRVFFLSGVLGSDGILIRTDGMKDIFLRPPGRRKNR